MSDHNFNTPPWLLDIVRKLDPKGVIGLDPCSNETSFVKARTSYCEEQNGLIQQWRSHGLVFMNPPHSMSPYNIEPWMEKAYEEFVPNPPDRWGSYPDQFVGLVPAKTDTDWFHRHASQFSCRLFLRGRIKFYVEGAETKGPGKFASMIVYHGPATGKFMSLFEGYGWMA